jgi:hypothetical protein
MDSTIIRSLKITEIFIYLVHIIVESTSGIFESDSVLCCYNGYRDSGFIFLPSCLSLISIRKLCHHLVPLLSHLKYAFFVSAIQPNCIFDCSKAYFRCEHKGYNAVTELPTIKSIKISVHIST